MGIHGGSVGDQRDNIRQRTYRHIYYMMTYFSKLSKALMEGEKNVKF